MSSSSQEYYKPHKIDKRKKGTFWRHMLAGGIAGAVSRTAVAPIERVKLIIQTQNLMRLSESEKYKGFFDALKRIPKEQGFLSLWRGNGTNVLRIGPNIAMRFAVYDKFKGYLMPKGSNPEEYELKQIFSHVLCGFFSGIMTLGVNYPLDVIRVRLSVDMNFKKNELDQNKQYNGFMDCMKKMIKNEGFRSLYQGYIFTLIGLAPYLAISFSTYDLLKYKFNLENIQNNNDVVSQIIGFLGVGSIAGTVAQISTQPLDVIRRRLQVNGGVNFEKLYKGSFDCISKTYRNEGFKGFYIGLGPNLAKIAPAAALQFTVYDIFKNFVFE